ncbi:7-carboxy-7-deazaguanine synthase QueE [Uliginosibacterium sp. H3]|uniref:7-carboxy-7-deazaguanine synthase n=1 Tax=Uliginosibacterium silvisoli TaxID=3114758 RepID=A0ABU6JZC7_9RHOO|nr:7-carboxy-7-deazaguanine synthase QueE [Uliginosibacterium sp. H3]
MQGTARGERLRITEIFFSVQGETSRAGLPTVFVRLTGCPLRCTWCDTEYAFHGGAYQHIDDILAEVARHGTPYVCVTGGEPLAQKPCLTLLSALCDAGYSVSLETSGALDISAVDARVSKIMDLKAPGSGEVDKNLWDNLAHLTPRDELKLVLAHEADYLWAREQFETRALAKLCPVLFSPVQGSLKPADLAEWVLRDKLAVRMQVQLHKVIWGNQQGR